MRDNCARKNDWNLRHDSPGRRKYLAYWDVEWRRWDVGSQVEVRHLLPATLRYRRCIGEIGISSFRLFERMFEAFTHSGYVTADTVWCSSWTEDLRFVSPMHEVGDPGVLAQGEPPSGLLSRTVPGGIYAVLETRGEPVLPHWMHEDWLDRQSRWTADMTLPVFLAGEPGRFAFSLNDACDPNSCSVIQITTSRQTKGWNDPGLITRVQIVMRELRGEIFYRCIRCVFLTDSISITSGIRENCSIGNVAATPEMTKWVNDDTLCKAFFGILMMLLFLSLPVFSYSSNCETGITHHRYVFYK